MESIWTQSVSLPPRKALDHDLETDVAVIGAGMAGVLTAWFLQQRGVRVVVLEANRVGSGQTQNTTAKITLQHSLTYQKLTEDFGPQRAAQYARANRQAIRDYWAIAKRLKISCQLEEVPAYLYTRYNPQGLEEEAQAAQDLGIAATLVRKTCLPFPVEAALCFPHQAQFHPLQFLRAVAEPLTIYERTPDFSKVTVTWVGDGNNMANSWIEAAMYFPFQLNMAIAPGYEPDQQLLALALQSGAKIFLTHDPKLAVDGANYIYADVWASMGQEEEQKKREEAFKGFCVDSELMSLAAPGVKFLHCLPAHRGEEVTDEVMESEASIVWDEAENRLHAQKAILEWVFSD